jgi:pyruvate kinase
MRPVSSHECLHTPQLLSTESVYGQANIVLSSDLSDILLVNKTDDPHLRKTKIVCTMGPSCWSVERLLEMIDRGMDVARLNFSHGDHAGHRATLNRIKEALALRPHKNIGFMLDTKGPEIRTGFLENSQPVDLLAGTQLILTTDYTFKGNASKIAVSYPKLCSSVKEKGIILVADGQISLEVLSIGDNEVVTRIINGGKLGEKKNMNLPGCKVQLPVIGDKDVDDIVNFAIPEGCHFIAASFVQHPDDVRYIRKILGEAGKHIKIISKIENQSGLKYFDDILEVSDGIMVARGDLGMEVPPEKVFLAQKMMIGKCNLKGKPVITATQMLESMIKNPRPTRAEASDVANAVLDGSDCVMLSGETASGDFPLHAVNIMRRVCEEAESVIDYSSLYNRIKIGVTSQNCGASGNAGNILSVAESICASAVKVAMDVGASAVIALTETGKTPKLMAKYRPAQVIVAVAKDPNVLVDLSIVRGVVCHTDAESKTSDQMILASMAWAKKEGIVKAGEKIVAVHGLTLTEEYGGMTNLMRILDVV